MKVYSLISKKCEGVNYKFFIRNPASVHYFLLSLLTPSQGITTQNDKNHRKFLFVEKNGLPGEVPYRIADNAWCIPEDYWIPRESLGSIRMSVSKLTVYNSERLCKFVYVVLIPFTLVICLCSTYSTRNATIYQLYSTKLVIVVFTYPKE